MKKGIAWRLVFLFATLLLFMLIVGWFLTNGFEYLTNIGSQISCTITKALGGSC